LNENDPDLVKGRVEFASKNTWQHRFDFLYSELNKILIKWECKVLLDIVCFSDITSYYSGLEQDTL